MAPLYEEATLLTGRLAHARFSPLPLSHAALLQTWSNLADTLVSQAELLEQQGIGRHSCSITVQ